MGWIRALRLTEVPIRRSHRSICHWFQLRFVGLCAGGESLLSSGLVDHVIDSHHSLAVRIRLSGSDLIILVFGISTRWQGMRDPAPPNPAISQGVLQSIVQLAQEQGANRLMLRVRKGNTKARTAYARAGFRTSRMIKHQSSEPTIELFKELPHA